MGRVPGKSSDSQDSAERLSGESLPEESLPFAAGEGEDADPASAEEEGAADPEAMADVTADDREEAAYWYWRRKKSLERPTSTYGLSRMARALPQTTRQALKKRGFVNGRLLLEWDRIMPEGVRGMARPLEVRRNLKQMEATLVLLVSSATAPILQHYEPQLLERINSYFGFRAVTRLHLVQGVLPPPEKARIIPPPQPDAAVEAEVAPVSDPALRQALARLKASVTAAGASKPKPAGQRRR